MKLSDLHLRESVNEPGGATPYLRYRSDERGNTITLDEGIVTIANAKGTVLVPLGMVRSMTPAPTPAAKK